jgi:hypothetical protein
MAASADAAVLFSTTCPFAIDIYRNFVARAQRIDRVAYRKIDFRTSNQEIRVFFGRIKTTRDPPAGHRRI